MDYLNIPPAQRRKVNQLITIVKSLKKTYGVPNKIFFKISREHQDDPKRTSSRKEQLKYLYKSLKSEDESHTEKSLFIFVVVRLILSFHGSKHIRTW